MPCWHLLEQDDHAGSDDEQIRDATDDPQRVRSKGRIQRKVMEKIEALDGVDGGRSKPARGGPAYGQVAVVQVQDLQGQAGNRYRAQKSQQNPFGQFAGEKHGADNGGAIDQVQNDVPNLAGCSDVRSWVQAHRQQVDVGNQADDDAKHEKAEQAQIELPCGRCGHACCPL